VFDEEAKRLIRFVERMEGLPNKSNELIDLTKILRCITKEIDLDQDNNSRNDHIYT
jgi:hypothetical protein